MPKRVDETQREIIEALRKCGVFVFPLHTVGKGCPDLLLAAGGRWFLAECKNGERKWKLTEDQKRFREKARAPILILTSATDAITWAANWHGTPGSLGYSGGLEVAIRREERETDKTTRRRAKR